MCHQPQTGSLPETDSSLTETLEELGGKEILKVVLPTPANVSHLSSRWETGKGEECILPRAPAAQFPKGTIPKSLS